MLSLMRSARLISYGFIGGLEPGVGSDTGLGIGRKYTLEYAIQPHNGDWRAAGLWRSGLEFNNPLIVRTVAPHQGTLPKRWGILDVSADNVVASALKPGRDGTAVLRVYEAGGQAASGVRVTFHVSIADTHEANLIEDNGAAIASTGDAVTFDLKPFEIRTFKFRVKAP